MLMVCKQCTCVFQIAVQKEEILTDHIALHFCTSGERGREEECSRPLHQQSICPPQEVLHRRRRLGRV
jgi:hypothetical protein